MSNDSRTPVPEGVETRHFHEFRVEGEDEAVTIEGHAATFGDPYRVADFEEQVAPGAFRASIKSDDVRALLNHDPNHLLGRNKSGTLRLAEDEVGLRAEVDVPASRADVAEAIERGDLDQMSFGFEVVEEEWKTRDGQPDLRTLKEVKLWDVSPVTYPANPNTDVAVQRHREFRSSLEAEGPETRQKRPTFDGTEEVEPEWADGAWGRPDLGDHPEADGMTWGELDDDARSAIAGRFIVGTPGADTYGDLGYPVVNPATDRLNRNGLLAARQRASAEDDSEVADIADALWDEFYAEEEGERQWPGSLREAVEAFWGGRVDSGVARQVEAARQTLRASPFDVDRWLPSRLADAIEEVVGNLRQTDQDIRTRIRSALQEAFGGEEVFIWIEATYMEESEVVYQRESDDDCALFRIGFSVAEDGTVELSGEPVEVVRVTSYEPVADAGEDEGERASDTERMRRRQRQAEAQLAGTR